MERKENSVSLALRELLGMEDKRHNEEQAIKAEEKHLKEEKKKKLEIEKRRVAQATKQAKELLILQKKANAKEKERVEEEHKLKIRLNAENEAKLLIEEKRAEYDLEVKKLELKARKSPKWIILIILPFTFVSISLGYYLYSSGEKKKKLAEQIALEEKQQLQENFTQQQTLILKQFREAEQEAEERLKEYQKLKGTVDEQKALLRFKKAQEKAKVVKKRIRRHRPKKARKAKKTKPRKKLNDDPLSGLDLGL